MKCCINCFQDTEIIGFILTNATEKGNCLLCQSTNVLLIDPRELEELFQPVVRLFKSIRELGISASVEKSLYQKIQENWNIFRPSDYGQSNALLREIVSGLLSHTDPLLNEPVEIEALFKSSLVSDVHEKKWDNFAHEIKFKNRFFLNETIDLSLLKDLFSFFAKAYDAGKIFYRARISDRIGFDAANMGKPSSDKATSGRANPSGIPYLYVSTDIETTVYESRSSYLDYLTIAEFRLTDKLHTVSLRGVAETSPFVFSDQLENYIAHQKYLIRLEQELSKPVKRVDKELDYLPSQYLCEYVKSLGYDAIEFGSSLRQGGINLAIFSDRKLESRTIEVYEINDVNLRFQKLQSSQ